MKNFIKLFVDIGPLAVFFIFYTRGDLQSAIFPLIIATIIAVLISYILEKKIPVMPTFGAIIIIIFGGLTLYLNNEYFFYMKPTIVNLIFAGILFAGILSKKLFLKYLFGNTLQLKDKGWHILTKRWIGFFIALAILNVIVVFSVSEQMWVNFKVFGILPLTFIFTIMQFNVIKKFQLENRKD